MRLEQPYDGDDAGAALWRSGYAWLAPEVSAGLTAVDASGWNRLRDYWSRLPPDAYLLDGGRYRSRRHASLVLDVASGALSLEPPRAHWQPVVYNALHGGLQRRFEPLEPSFVAEPIVTSGVVAIGRLVASLRPTPRWYVEVHQVRIDTAGGVGRPTPEGAHRDGVDFAAVWLVGRDALRGGETRVFEAEGPEGVRFTMTRPGSVLVLDDRRVIHETTPVLPGVSGATRDTMIVTYRADGFLAPP